MKKESFSWPPGCLFTMIVHEELCSELKKKSILEEVGPGGEGGRKEAVTDSRLLSCIPPRPAPRHRAAGRLFNNITVVLLLLH